MEKKSLNDEIKMAKWVYTDMYPSGMYKLSSDGGTEHIPVEYTKLESSAAQNKTVDFINSGTNLKSELEENVEGFTGGRDDLLLIPVGIIVLILILIYGLYRV